MINFPTYKKEQSAISRLLFSFFLSLLPILLSGQNKQKEIAIGYSIIHEKLPEGYNYTPLFITARFPIHQFRTKKKNSFSVFLEPQFVLNQPTNPFPTTFEFGVNLGFLYTIPLTSKSSLAASISAGPHYLSLETSIQAKGFIFSDNIEIGYYQQIGKQIGISVKPRFRHISNAGFLSPNIGIDNLFLMLGITWKAL